MVAESIDANGTLRCDLKVPPSVAVQSFSEEDVLLTVLRIGGAYLIANAAAGPIWVKISDIWGRKPILLASVAGFFGASVVCAKVC